MHDNPVGTVAVAAVIALNVCAEARGGVRQWSSPSSGFWTGAANWSPAVVPRYDDQVFIGPNTGQCDLAGVDELFLEGGGALSMNGGALRWQAVAPAGWIHQGYSSRGSLSISAGGSFIVNSPHQWTVGYLPSGYGSITVTDSSSRLEVRNAQTWLGLGGRAELSVLNGGFAELNCGLPVALDPGSSATIVVSGPSSVLVAPDFHTCDGTAVITVSQGARLTASRFDLATGLRAGGRTTATISDPQSRVFSSTIRLADINATNKGMTATLDVRSGARVVATTEAVVGKGGTILLDPLAASDVQVGPTPRSAEPVDSGVHIGSANPGQVPGRLSMVGGEVRSPVVNTYPPNGLLSGFGTLAGGGNAPLHVLNAGQILTNGKDAVKRFLETAELFIDGSLTQTQTGALTVTLGQQHRRSPLRPNHTAPVSVAGLVSLSGYIQIKTLPSLSLSIGEEYSLIDATSRVGRFSSNVSGYSAESFFRVKYGTYGPVATVTAVVAPRASLLFRSNGESSVPWIVSGNDIPGWDHAALQLDNRVYESHPGYKLVDYYSRFDAPEVKRIPNINGVQDVHSFGSFMHDWPEPEGTDVTSTMEVAIPRALGWSMASSFMAWRGRTFAYIDPTNFTSLWNTARPSLQKGAEGRFTCVGAIERAAELAGLDGGQGFIPNARESLRVSVLGVGVIEVPLLSPSLLAYYAGSRTLANRGRPSEINADGQVVTARPGHGRSGAGSSGMVRGAVQGLAILRNAEVVVTDPLGRRFGNIAGTGTLNEIPMAFFSGAGEMQQFAIERSVPGVYEVRLVGRGGTASAAIAGSAGEASWEGAMPEGTHRSMSIRVLGTIGDADDNGVVDGSDVTTVVENWNLAGDWGLGDFDGDAMVGESDLRLVLLWRTCPSDLNSDGIVDDADFTVFVSAYDAVACPQRPGMCLADQNVDGYVDDVDFQTFAVAYDRVECN
jgi:T5SS/PEP-CTERM-associated repeat protein